MFTFTALAADPPPVPKSGTLTFDHPMHWHQVTYKTGEKREGATGEWWGALVPRSDSKFLRLARWEGVYGVQFQDKDKGIQSRFGTAQILDGDKDAVFTSQNCKMNAWSDWCGSTIEGGTGKYEGITGTVRWAFNFESPWFVRATPDGIHPVKSRFEDEGEGPLVVEISWKMP
jgi:hypothetical protein